MDTRLADFIRDTPAGKEAEAILRSCVHCGFCNATCPTYQLQGDELDGPRGRIYLIKQLLEGQQATEKTRLHLDRCLTCRSCETTCPSGVRFTHLLDIGRRVIHEKLPRRTGAGLTRWALREALPRPQVFAPLVRLGQTVRPFLPSFLADRLPMRATGARKSWPAGREHGRRMLALAGCVQPSLAPNINAATARVFDRLGINLFEAASTACCGALRFHLDDQERAKADMRRNIDAWWPHVEAGIEAIVVTASGCGIQVREYAHALAGDPDYADKAVRIGSLCRDPAEILLAERSALLELLASGNKKGGKLAFHSPCSLQHGLKIRGAIEEFLVAAGFVLTAVPDAHLCCGSAGTYSILQPELSARLRENKLAALNSGGPERVVTANIGCLTHLQAGGALPVRHWIEEIDEVIS